MKSELESISRDLDVESRECEMMRVKYDHLWTQEPSASLNKSLRQDLKSHSNALEAAATSDQQVSAIWDTVKGDISLVLSSGLEELFRASVQPSGTESLLDLEISTETRDEEERARIGQYTTEIEERLGRIKKITYERNEVLKDLKDKVVFDLDALLLLLTLFRSKQTMFHIFFSSTAAIAVSNPPYSLPSSKSLDHTSNDCLPPCTTNRSLCKKFRTCGRI